MNRTSLLAVVGLLLSGPALAKDHAPTPTNVALPDGFHPEGITSAGNTLFVAEFDNGSVLKVDARTGKSTVLVPPIAGRQGLGIKLDKRTNLLFVAGGATGHAYVYDASTGAPVADYTLSSGTTFINDLLITPDAVFFTDSFQPVLYELPLGKHGKLPPAGASRTIALAGDFTQVPDTFNLNGIEQVDGCGDLIVINSATGKLFRVDPTTGFASAIDLGGGSLVNGDGLVFHGGRLWVIENFSSAVVAVKLSHDARRGKIVETITSPKFDILATGTFVGDTLFVTNARFNTPVTPTTPYWLTRIPLGD
jgi:sugar lactone lactonase YvrE